MAKSTKKAEPTAIEIVPISMGRITCYLLGASGLIMHRYPFKAWQELLFPKGRANAAERADSLKHDPLNEYRQCMYKNRDPKEPALIHFPKYAFSKGMAAAALDLPGSSKAQILRLVSISSFQINLFGIPKMGMEMVRMADPGRTPDVRTRAYFSEWACKLEIEYVSSLVKQNQVVSLLAAAGMIVGIGDNRQQKGGGWGKYRVVEANDPDYLRIVKEQGRAAQLAAYEKPELYDAETEELYSWFLEESARREKVIPSLNEVPAGAAAASSKRRGNGAHTHQ